MRFFRIILFCGILIPSGSIVAQDTLKVMWYNILNYPDINSSRISYLQTILQYVKPDIFVVCEITSASGASTILNSALNVGTSSYAMVNYTDGPDDENMLFYNTEKLGFIEQNEIAASPRQFNEYVLYYKNPTLTAASDTAYLYLYAAHLKAGNTSSDATERGAAAAILKSYLNTRPYSENTILGGDMNMYTSSETAYFNFTGESQANLYDPVGPGNYNNNSSFAIHHTQSTRIEQIDGGSNGGMDDRFDMMLFSDDIRYATNGVQFISGSYKAIGQDGQHFNMAINSPANTSVPANVLNALYYMSDHLPIYMELKVGGEVGLDENWMSDHVNVYPNPATEVLYVETEGMDQVVLELTDMSGRTVINQVSMEGVAKLDVSSLESGYYLLRVSSEKGSTTKHVLIR